MPACAIGNWTPIKPVAVSRATGPAALWKGLTPRLARTPPGQAIVWAVSDQITGYFEQQRQLA